MKTIDNAYRVSVRGRIAAGCKAAKVRCSSCNRDVVASRMNGEYRCSSCGGRVEVGQGSRIFMKSLDHFVVPEEVAAVIGQSPKSIRIIPAYPTADRTLVMGYAKWVASKRRPVCYGNGQTAYRFDFNRGKYTEVACNEDCPDRLKKACRFEATFRFLIPEVDVMAAYDIVTHSEQSAGNIYKTLKKLQVVGILNRAVCELKIIEKQRISDNAIYRVLDLIAPKISIQQVQRLRGRSLDLLGLDIPVAEERCNNQPEDNVRLDML